MKEKPVVWIGALRSGKYTQGSWALFNGHDSSFCCLGVLAHTCGIHPVDFDSVLGAGVLDNPDHCGLKTCKGNLPFEFADNRDNSLVDLNDSGLTFTQIADVIEYFWTEL